MSTRVIGPQEYRQRMGQFAPWLRRVRPVGRHPRLGKQPQVQLQQNIIAAKPETPTTFLIVSYAGSIAGGIHENLIEMKQDITELAEAAQAPAGGTVGGSQKPVKAKKMAVMLPGTTVQQTFQAMNRLFSQPLQGMMKRGGLPWLKTAIPPDGCRSFCNTANGLPKGWLLDGQIKPGPGNAFPMEAIVYVEMFDILELLQWIQQGGGNALWSSQWVRMAPVTLAAAGALYNGGKPHLFGSHGSASGEMKYIASVPQSVQQPDSSKGDEPGSGKTSETSGRSATSGRIVLGGLIAALALARS